LEGKLIAGVQNPQYRYVLNTKIAEAGFLEKYTELRFIHRKRRCLLFLSSEKCEAATNFDLKDDYFVCYMSSPSPPFPAVKAVLPDSVFTGLILLILKL